MNKRILFVILPFYITEGIMEKSYPTMPYGILSIAKYINRCADIKIFDCNLHGNYHDALTEEMISFNPNIVGLSMMFDASFWYLDAIINTIKYYDETIPILLGGVATTNVYREILNEGLEIDAICYGDGELPMADYLINSRFNESWVTKLSDTPKKSLLADLDEVIDIDYSLINIGDYRQAIVENYSPFFKELDRTVQLYCMTSRGCCFSCTFCTNSLNLDKKIRYASVDAIMAHVESVVCKYGLNILSFIDDQLLHDKIKAKELFRRLMPYKLKIKIPGGVAPIFLDEEMVALMWHAGLDSITLALESGSDEVLKIMRKPVKLDQVRTVMEWVRKYNFFVRINLVTGMPGETDCHRQETIEYIREIDPDVISPSIASPVYGSKLRQDCIEKGYINNVHIGTYNRQTAVINTPEYSANHVKEQTMYMIWRTNFVENRRMRIGDYEVAKDYFLYVTDKYPNEAFAWFYLNKAKEQLGELVDWTKFNKCMSDDLMWTERFMKLGVIQ